MKPPSPISPFWFRRRRRLRAKKSRRVSERGRLWETGGGSPSLRSARRPFPGGGATVHLVLASSGSVRSGKRGGSGGAKHGVKNRGNLRSGVHRGHALINPSCYSACAGTGRFRPSLTVARKFRLCLRPRGTLRVQSLRLPRFGAWFGVVRPARCYHARKENAIAWKNFFHERQRHPTDNVETMNPRASGANQ